MIHHNVNPIIYRIRHFIKGKHVLRAYGVSPAIKAISPQCVLKNFDTIRQFLSGTLGLTTAQREVVFRLLRLWSYYGVVYPKQSQVTEAPGCSKATFWRTIALLRDLNLLTVVNRYLVREQAQISNLYDLEKLVLAIARYLAERGKQFHDSYLAPFLRMPGSLFWRAIYSPNFPSPPPRLARETA